MSKKAIIAIVVIVVLIVISIVSFLIYRNSKNKKAEAEQRLAALQQQLNSQPNMPVDQKANLLGQIAQLLGNVQGNVQLPQFTPGTTPNPALDTNNNVAPNGFPLKKNVTGMALYNQAVQKAVNGKCGDKLKAIGMAPLVADGKFGPLTEKGIAACLGTTTVSWEQYKSLVA